MVRSSDVPPMLVSGATATPRLKLQRPRPSGRRRGPVPGAPAQGPASSPAWRGRRAMAWSSSASRVSSGTSACCDSPVAAMPWRKRVSASIVSLATSGSRMAAASMKRPASINACASATPVERIGDGGRFRRLGRLRPAPGAERQQNRGDRKRVPQRCKSHRGWMEDFAAPSCQSCSAHKKRAAKRPPSR